MPRSIEEIRKAKREHMARRRAADPQGERAYRRAYHAANRDARTAKMRAYYGRRFFWGKAMKLRGEDRATAKELAALWKAQRGRCALTGRRLDRSAQLDHKTPKARGGGDNPANLQWLCVAANLAKRDLTDAEFAALCGDVMAWIGRRIAAVEALQNLAEAA
jgi:5-methylcytosine-specific restriction endonuclease McrA